MGSILSHCWSVGSFELSLWLRAVFGWVPSGFGGVIMFAVLGVVLVASLVALLILSLTLWRSGVVFVLSGWFCIFLGGFFVGSASTWSSSSSSELMPSHWCTSSSSSESGLKRL